MKLSSLYFGLLVLLSCAGAASVEAEESGLTAIGGRGRSDDDISQEVFTGFKQGAQDAATLVAKARHLLDEIESSTRLHERQSTPTYMRTFLYYLQMFLDTIFLANVPTQEEPLTALPRGGAAPMSKTLSKAVDLLKRAAGMRNADAQYLLAEMNFYGNWSHPRNYPESMHWYKELASGSGNRSAQNMVGFMYATGYGGAVEKDQAKALVYHTFAALSGDTRSEMTVAFRHHAGIGTPRSCDDAAFFYKRAADKAMEWYLSGPPGGMHMARNSFRLADDQGGIYGEGASHVSAGSNARRRHGDQGSSMDDVLEYLDLLARKGDDSASVQLAKLYYDGPKGMKRDLFKARYLFAKVAKKYWTSGSGNTPNPKASNILRDTATRSAGYLGRMYLRGEAVTRDDKKAVLWFKRGLSHGDSMSQHGLGYMYEFGLGGLKISTEKSAKLYTEAANSDYGPAQVAIARIFQQKGEISAATKWFELASRHGIIDAYYWLAEMANNGQGKERSCSVATIYYKVVAERVEILHSPLQWAHDSIERGDRDSALIGYMMAAEQGYESGQANVAWLLDEAKSTLSLTRWKQQRNDPREQELALTYWTRSAKQSNIDSFVKMGDYYLAGIGTEMDYAKAASSYQAASEYQASAQALWNLGWMHENGIGVEKDYHLAKRYYDQALESNAEAYLPVAMSLLKLRIKSFWNDITHGGINAMGNDPEPEQDWSFRDWLRKWFSDDPHGHRQRQMQEQEAADAATAEAQEIPDLAGNDMYDADFDDDAIENLIILGLFMMLALLFFIRNQRQNAQRNQQQQQQDPGQQPAQPPQAPFADGPNQLFMPQPFG